MNTLSDLRHKCEKHPENALRLLRAELGLQSTYRWLILGTHAYVTYCPWCGADLEALRALPLEALRGLPEFRPEGVDISARVTPIRRHYDAPAIVETLREPPAIESRVRFQIADLPGKEQRTLTLVAPQAMPHSEFQCSAVQGCFVRSLRVSGNEQLFAGMVPLELFQGFDGDRWDMDIAANAPIELTVYNATTSPASFTIDICNVPPDSDDA